MGDYADRRRTAIEDAAFALLIEKGYKATSMLEVARRAGASNETLYKWYDNKQGLFAALVQANARAVAELLRDHLGAAEANPLETLSAVGPLLLNVVTGERAIALNRAAVGDVHDTATLGKALAQSGRDTVVPLLVSLMEQMREKQLVVFDNPAAVAEIYIALLIGDLQIRRATGAIGPLTDDEMRRRSERAVTLLRQLHAP